MQRNNQFRSLKITKCNRRAYSVSGEPVVTLGVVDIGFKIGTIMFSHQYTIVRGLIHPMLIGMDFLLKHRANINLGDKPKLRLTHPNGSSTITPFVKSVPRVKTSTHVALSKDIEIPPMSSYLADAYMTNIDSVKPTSADDERIMGITSIQKVDEFFDPGFLLRDAIISTNTQNFKVELLNPSHWPLKVDEDTPVGVIFDHNCEVEELKGPPTGRERNRKDETSHTSPTAVKPTSAEKNPPKRQMPTKSNGLPGVIAAILSKHPPTTAISPLQQRQPLRIAKTLSAHPEKQCLPTATSRRGNQRHQRIHIRQLSFLSSKDNPSGWRRQWQHIQRNKQYLPTTSSRMV